MLHMYSSILAHRLVPASWEPLEEHKSVNENKSNCTTPGPQEFLVLHACLRINIYYDNLTVYKSVNYQFSCCGKLMSLSCWLAATCSLQNKG